MSNKQLMSDEELLKLKSELSVEEIDKVLKRKYRFFIPPIGEINTTLSEIQETLNINDIEKILLDKNMDDNTKEKYITEYIAEYLAFVLETPVYNLNGANTEDEAKQLIKKVMSNYMEEYIEYNTMIGKIVVQRRDIPLLSRAYINAVLVLIYLICFNWFTEWFIDSNTMFFIGTFLNLMTLWTIGKITLRVWSISYNGKSS